MSSHKNLTTGQDDAKMTVPFAKATSVPCTSAAFAELSAEFLRAGRTLRFRAVGSSMQPLVRDGDILLVQPLGSRPAQAGDVVLCSPAPGLVLVHRVVRRLDGPGGRRLTVQGDQLVRPDAEIPEAQVLGRVGAIERAGARIDMDQPMMRLLGWLVALRSRSNVGRGRPCRLALRLLRRLPGFSRYLA
jgi:hypothetical protein